MKREKGLIGALLISIAANFFLAGVLVPTFLRPPPPPLPHGPMPGAFIGTLSDRLSPEDTAVLRAISKDSEKKFEATERQMRAAMEELRRVLQAENFDEKALADALNGLEQAGKERHIVFSEFLQGAATRLSAEGRRHLTPPGPPGPPPPRP